MTQTQNISLRNALVRITMGLSMVAYGTSHLIKEPASNRGRMMIVLGAMKAGEGTLRYCPTKAVLNTSIQNIMSESGALGNTGNSPMQNMGSAMQNVGSTVQNMMGGAGSGTATGTATGSGSGSGLQNVVPEVTKLMKDFAGIGNAGGNNQSNTAGTGNTTATSSVFGATGGNATKNNSTTNNNPSGNTSNSSTTKPANNNAYGDPNKNNNGNRANNGTNGNKNGSAPINPS